MPEAAGPRVVASPGDLRRLEGTTIGDRYALRRLIGEGGFGGVFRSDQLFAGARFRTVAVKVSKHSGLTAADVHELFTDAFVLAQAMEDMHEWQARSHLVHVYDVGLLPEDGRAYVVMEFVEGTTLEAQFRSLDRVPAPLVVKWVRQACAALRALHALQPPLVHRDLKPDNVLLGTDLNVRVADFGLAARLLAGGFVPGVAGTIAYMAPETSMGRSTPASDVYSLGLILYEGLTGVLPFAHLVPPVGLPESSHAGWLFEQKRTVRPDPPSRRSNTSPPELDAVVLRCLKFSPGDRYANAGALLDALDAADSGCGPADADSALAAARGLRHAGELGAARRSLEGAVRPDLLETATASTRFALYRELGTVLAELDEPLPAAGWLAKAWEVAEGSAVLRSAIERAALLEQVALAYARAGLDDYQARHYRTLAEREKRPRDGRRATGL